MVPRIGATLGTMNGTYRSHQAAVSGGSCAPVTGPLAKRRVPAAVMSTGRSVRLTAHIRVRPSRDSLVKASTPSWVSIQRSGLPKPRAEVSLRRRKAAR